MRGSESSCGLLLHTRTATWVCDEWQAGRAQWAWQDGYSVVVAIWCDAFARWGDPMRASVRTRDLLREEGFINVEARF